jgi:hypothetical protein
MTRDEAIAQAHAEILADTEADEDEASLITACTREDCKLYDLPDAERHAIMEACPNCERIHIAPPGRA